MDNFEYRQGGPGARLEQQVLEGENFVLCYLAWTVLILVQLMCSLLFEQTNYIK